MTLLLGAVIGLLVSAVLLAVGLFWNDRWISLAAGLALIVFLGAVVLLGGWL